MMKRLFISLFFTGFLSLIVLPAVHAQVKNAADLLKFEHLNLEPKGLAPQSKYLGISAGFIFYSSGSSKTIQVLKLKNNSIVNLGAFPLGFSVDTAIVTEKEVICFSGKSVRAFRFDSLARKLETRLLDNLPFAGNAKFITYNGQTLYVAKEALAAGSEINVWSITLNELIQGGKWIQLPPYQSQTGYLSFVNQNNVNYSIDGIALRKLDLKNKKWIQVVDLPAVVKPYTSYALGPFHIVLIGLPLIDGQKATFYLFHTITNKWVASTIDVKGKWLAPVLTKNKILIPTVDGIGNLQLATGVQQVKKSNIGTWDYLTLVVYFVGLFFISYYFSKRKKTTNEYFKGGKRVPWYASGISIVATKLSAVSFVSLPAKAFTSNWTYLLVPAGNIVIAWFVVRYVIPFFCRLDVTSAYEYLEKRFNVWVRTIASLNFLIFELVKIGVIFIVPAVVLNVTVGVSIFYSIALIGITTTIYTLIGGIEGVIWTEAAQVLVMIGGTIAAIVIIFLRLDYSVPFIDTLISDGKLKAIDLTWDFSKSTFWVIVIYWVGSLKNYISNQTIIQRYLATKDEKQAAKGIWFANLLNIPVIWLFLLLGTALYLYYGQNPGKANPVMDQPDALLPWFIMLELPAGIAGLLIAGIFAASMSTLESSLNSMSTVMVTDFYQRYSKQANEVKSVKLGKLFVVILGLAGTVAGLILATQQIQSLYDKFFELIGLFGGGLGGLFLLGMMTEKANARGTLIGFGLSAVFQFYITYYTSLNFFTYLFTGMMSCFLFGYLFSLLLPANQKKIHGLTIHTLNKIDHG